MSASAARYLHSVASGTGFELPLVKHGPIHPGPDSSCCMGRTRSAKIPLNQENSCNRGRLRLGDLLSKLPNKKSGPNSRREDFGIPVWLEATESFYRKLNRVSDDYDLTRYEALNRGLDALVREIRMDGSPLSRVVLTRQESATFRKTMGIVARKYWATVPKEEKRARAQKSAQARWAKVKNAGKTGP